MCAILSFKFKSDNYPERVSSYKEYLAYFNFDNIVWPAN